MKRQQWPYWGPKRRHLKPPLGPSIWKNLSSCFVWHLSQCRLPLPMWAPSLCWRQVPGEALGLPGSPCYGRAVLMMGQLLLYSGHLYSVLSLTGFALWSNPKKIQSVLCTTAFVLFKGTRLFPTAAFLLWANCVRCQVRVPFVKKSHCSPYTQPGDSQFVKKLYYGCFSLVSCHFVAS